MKTSKIFYLFVLILAILACKNPNTAPEEEPTGIETEDWITLFDGSTTVGWRGFNQDTLPSGWSIEDGSLKGTGEGGDIVFGNREFQNFDLQLEWKISEGGNSGIFYHVREGERFHTAYENAPEYQLIDDDGFPGGLEEWQTSGSDYAMYTPDRVKKVLNPVGDWNSSRITFTPEKVEYWLNGSKVLEFVPWSEDWQTRHDNSKWVDFPEYGKAKTGLIGLQDHGSNVWFRDIKIRVL